MLNCTARPSAELEPNSLLIGIDIDKKQHACIAMDLRARVLIRLKFSNSRRGFERFWRRRRLLGEKLRLIILSLGWIPPVTTDRT